MKKLATYINGHANRLRTLTVIDLLDLLIFLYIFFFFLQLAHAFIQSDSTFNKYILWGIKPMMLAVASATLHQLSHMNILLNLLFICVSL